MQMHKFLDFSNLKADLLAGVTAGVVALPLCLAFGVQSGLGAIAGLYGAIMLGFFAALFGGTETQVSGPTGPMTVVSALVVASAIELSGTLEQGMGVIIASFLLAGGFQIVAGLLGIGKYIRYIPYPVLSGFMSGIGVIIILFQIYPFLGHKSASGTLDILLRVGGPLSNPNWAAVGLGALTVAVIYLFPRITRAVPSALVALLVATLAAVVLKLDVPLIGDIPAGIPELKLSTIFSVDPSLYWTVIEFAAMLAALGCIDSLLTSVIADNITKTKHHSNRELIGQGIGNMAGAAIGGLPGAGATMRTVVNINAGGRTRISGATHAVLLAAVLLGLGRYAAYIPLSVLAGILITVGIGIIDYRGFRHLLHVPRTDAVILVIVLLITVFGNLLHAVGVGVVLACVLFMKKAGELAERGTIVQGIAEHAESHDRWQDEGDFYRKFKHEIYIKHVYGQLFFGFTADFQERVKKLPPEVKLLIIRLDQAQYMDQSGLYALEQVVLELEKQRVVVLLTGVHAQPLDMLRRIDFVPGLVPERHIFGTLAECESWLCENLHAEEGFKKIVDELHEIRQAKVAYRM